MTAREDISAVSISVFSYIPVVSEGLVIYFTTSSLDATEGNVITCVCMVDELCISVHLSLVYNYRKSIH